MAAAEASIFASAEVIKWLNADQNYVDVVGLITKEINNAYCKAEQQRKGGLGISCDTYSPKVYGEEKVKTILNIYIQVLLDNASLPEYDALTTEKLTASAPTIAAVAQSAGERDEATVRMVLGQLFWMEYGTKPRPRYKLHPTAHSSQQRKIPHCAGCVQKR